MRGPPNRILCLFAVICYATFVKSHNNSTALFEEIDGHDGVGVSFRSDYLSGCALCQQTGDCDHAFRGQPGQFCHTLVSGRPCCCPVDSECTDNVYNCRCRRVAYQQVYPHGAVTPTVVQAPRKHHGWSIWTILFVFLLLFGCCYCLCTCGRPNDEYERIDNAGPYPPPQYGSYNEPNTTGVYATPVPAATGYGPQVVQNSGGYGSLASGAVGAATGFTTGMMVDSALRGREDREPIPVQNTSAPSYIEFSGDAGGNDFSGDAARNHFSGDAGGDNFNGDSGDDTFAGDS
uniref:Uncharacterized protein AlNc14C92G5720 n=1 Tax=Albugo laibachii Nc14 TaxID=890382 RepID=F0WGI6_9STRA|nr:conserved hypothetical protein [Albugo laibachii Nc14]|eukprot:CCA20350.1 conserved hypothetical protein [Albugo laibachii Nc14]